jgi:hypothetical protein
VLLTSRRDERGWLAGLPARVRLPGMPMREAIQLAAALAARHGASLAAADWRPLLRYAAGNPLTITVLAGQAAQENLTTTAQVEAFVDRLRAGEAALEPGQDQALGRTRSLAASLSYGFAQAFTGTERARLAVLHLFRDTADADALRYMGDPQVAGDDTVPGLAGLDYDAWTALLDRAAGTGLLEPLGGGYYQVHPALPWYFTTMFTTTYGPPGNPAAQRATRAYTRAIGDLGHYYWGQGQEGRTDRVLGALRAEEANLRHALHLARASGLWRAAAGCLQGLRILYEPSPRTSPTPPPAAPGPAARTTGASSPATRWTSRSTRGTGPPPPPSSTPGPRGTGTGPPGRSPPRPTASRRASATSSANSASPSLTSAASSTSSVILAACPATRRPWSCSSGPVTAPPRPASPAASAAPSWSCPGCVTWTRPGTGTPAACA